MDLENDPPCAQPRAGAQLRHDRGQEKESKVHQNSCGEAIAQITKPADRQRRRRCHRLPAGLVGPPQFAGASVPALAAPATAPLPLTTPSTPPTAPCTP